MAFKSRSPYQAAGVFIENTCRDKGEVIVTAKGLVLSVGAGEESNIKDTIVLALATLLAFAELSEVDAITELQRTYEGLRDARANNNRPKLPN